MSERKARQIHGLEINYWKAVLTKLELRLFSNNCLYRVICIAHVLKGKASEYVYFSIH